MTTATEMRDRILSRAAADVEFRARLIADPKAAIAAETGMSIPEGFDVAVHEDSADHGAPGAAALASADGGRAGDSRRWARLPGPGAHLV